MVKSKFTPDQKVQIVLESIKTNISTAELCRKHNLHPQTFHTGVKDSWRQARQALPMQEKRILLQSSKKSVTILR